MPGRQEQPEQCSACLDSTHYATQTWQQDRSPGPMQAPKLLPEESWGLSLGGAEVSWFKSRTLKEAPQSSQTQMLLLNSQKNS